MKTGIYTEFIRGCPGSWLRQPFSDMASLWAANSPHRTPGPPFSLSSGFPFQLPLAVLWASPVENASHRTLHVAFKSVFSPEFLPSVNGYRALPLLQHQFGLFSQTCHSSTAGLSIPTRAASSPPLHPPLFLTLTFATISYCTSWTSVSLLNLLFTLPGKCDLSMGTM